MFKKGNLIALTLICLLFVLHAFSADSDENDSENYRNLDRYLHYSNDEIEILRTEAQKHVPYVGKCKGCKTETSSATDGLIVYYGKIFKAPWQVQYDKSRSLILVNGYQVYPSPRLRTDLKHKNGGIIYAIPREAEKRKQLLDQIKLDEETQRYRDLLDRDETQELVYLRYLKYKKGEIKKEDIFKGLIDLRYIENISIEEYSEKKKSLEKADNAAHGKLQLLSQTCSERNVPEGYIKVDLHVKKRMSKTISLCNPKDYKIMKKCWEEYRDLKKLAKIGFDVELNSWLHPVQYRRPYSVMYIDGTGRHPFHLNKCHDFLSSLFLSKEEKIFAANLKELDEQCSYKYLTDIQLLFTVLNN